jgi:hypothetical protein
LPQVVIHLRDDFAPVGLGDAHQSFEKNSNAPWFRISIGRKTGKKANKKTLS